MYVDDAKHMEKRWNRRVAAYDSIGEVVICSVWAEDERRSLRALTGWVLYIASPSIIDFKGEKCLAVPLEAWLKLKQLGDETATPFRVAAKGKNLIAKAFMPHVALKHAIKQAPDDSLNTVMPVGEFKIV